MLISETGFEAYGLLSMTRLLGMSEEEAKKVCKDAFAMLKDRHVHAYSPV
jgi:hypothetical protein